MSSRLTFMVRTYVSQVTYRKYIYVYSDIYTVNSILLKIEVYIKIYVYTAYNTYYKFKNLCFFNLYEHYLLIMKNIYKKIHIIS